MPRHLLFRFIIVQLLFFGATCLQATSTSSASAAIKAKIKQLESADVDPVTWANNLVELGTIYTLGKDVPKDIKKALTYLTLVAKQDVNRPAQAQANVRLGVLYSGGELKNVIKAREYLEKAANQNANPAVQAQANFWLGTIYSRDELQNVFKAREHFEKAAQQNIDRKAQAEANLWLGTIYMNSELKDIAKAREYYEKAAHQDVLPDIQAKANNELGKVYSSGELKDIKRAREYYEKAANQDVDPGTQLFAKLKLAELQNVSAPTAEAEPTESVSEKIKRLGSTNTDPVTRANNLVELGDIYSDWNGKGLGDDYKQALKYYEEAARQDVNKRAKAKANYRIGKIFRLGAHDVTKDIPRAIGYLQQAAIQKADPVAWAHANYILGGIYYGEGGSDVKLDAEKAIGYLQKAAKQDVDSTAKAAANYSIGLIYANGSSNVKKDTEKAIGYLQKAAKQDAEPVVQASATFRLGMIYLDDLKDGIQARKYYEKVANQDAQRELQARANYELGIMYHEGLYGLKKDDTKAREYFEKAENQKDELETRKKAQQKLVELSAEEKAISGAPQTNEQQESIAKALSTMRTVEALLSQQISKAQDFLDADKLFEQVSIELKNAHNEATLAQKVSLLRKMIDLSRNIFVDKQEVKILQFLGKTPTSSLIKAAKKLIAELELLQMPERRAEIKSLNERIEKWSKPSATATEPTEQEKKAQQEQQVRQARNLIKELDEALENKDLDIAAHKLRDIQQLTITDADIRKQIATLQNQYKKQKADALQNQFEEALAKYKEKPSSARSDKAKEIIRALADLNIPERRDFITEANKRLRALEKESAAVPEKKGVSPTLALEPQQLLFIFDPYNQLEPLPKEIKSRAEEALNELSLGHKDPTAIKLSYGENLWRIRVGNYRIVYERLPKKDAVAIVMIDARKEVYEAEDEQLQKAREDYLIDINDWPTDKLLSDAEELLKKTASVSDAAKAEPLLELYRWQLRGYPANQDYLKSLLLSGKAAFKMNDLAKARELFADMIPQAIDFPQIKKQAEASLAEVEKRLVSFQAGRRITPPSPGRVSPIPQEDVVGKLREKYQEAQQLLVTNPEKATLALEQFSKESSAHAAELTNERKGADTLLNNEPIFVSAEQALEEGEYDDAITFFNTYLKEVGKFIPTRRRQLINEEIAQSELGRAIRREVEKRLVK